MKKILMILIVLVIILSGCNDEMTIIESIRPSYPNPSESADIIIKSSGIPVIIKTEFSDYFEKIKSLNINYPTYPSGSYLNLSDWQDYIYKKFDIELYVSYKTHSAKELLQLDNDSFLYLNFMKGFIFMNSIHLFNYAKPDVSYDLTPYYSKYEWNQYIEKQYIDALTVNNEIFAVPAVNGKYIVPRYYNKEYLGKLNMKIPSTVNEFYEYLSASKNINSSDNLFYPMCILSTSLTKSTSDIFRAFNVYVDSEINTSITYNPNTDSYEDAVYAENFENAMLFIRLLQDEKLLTIQGHRYIEKEGMGENLFSNDLFSMNKNFATEYNYVYDSTYNRFTNYVNAKTTYEKVNGYWLEGINSTNLCEVRSDLAFYVFPNSIKNINGVIDLFNDVFTKDEYYGDLKYGVEKVDYNVLNNLYVVNEPKSGSLLDIKQIKYKNDPMSNYVPESSEIIENISNSSKFEKNVFNMILFNLDYNEEIKLNYSNNGPLEFLFSNKVDYFDSIEEYKVQFKKLGMDEIIKNLNNRLGKVMNYDYY